MDTFEYFTTKRFQHVVVQCLIASLALALLTVVCHRLHFNLATASLLYVIVVALLARTGSVVTSIFASISAALCLAYLAPPTHSFRIDDPLDGVAVAAFLVTSLLIAQLVSRLRRMTEEALSSVDRRLIDAEEQERTRIARELHDDIGQRIALLTVELGQFSHSPDLTADVCGRICELRKQSAEIATDIQALSHELHSSKLEYLGIVTAMKGFCEELSAHKNVEVVFAHDAIPRVVPSDISLCLFRVLQEALHNAAKYSGVRHFDAELRASSDAIDLTVRDSGLGFDPKAAIKGRGLGLISMQERIKLVKGEFSVDSQPNRGTTIHARVPFSA